MKFELVLTNNILLISIIIFSIIYLYWFFMVKVPSMRRSLLRTKEFQDKVLLFLVIFPLLLGTIGALFSYYIYKV